MVFTMPEIWQKMYCVQPEGARFFIFVITGVPGDLGSKIVLTKINIVYES